MKRSFAGASCAALMVSAFGLASGPAWAASFNVPDNATDNTAKTVSGTDVGTVGVNASLSVTGTAISWNNASTGLVITNSGTIQSTAAGARAINASGGNNTRTLTLTNNASGLITSDDDAFRINVDPTGGTILIQNYGTILAQNGQALDFTAAVGGGASITINNYAGATLRSNGQDGIRPGQGAIVNNAGTIFATGAAGNSYDGVDFQGSSGTVNNQTGGTISGLRHGITTDTGVVVVNASGATITGRNGSGVGSDGTGTVTNYGTITGAYAGNGTGDGDGVDIDFAATITNFGTIQGTGAGGFDSGGRANNSEGISIGGGTIANSGLVSGAGPAIVVNNDSNTDGSRSGVAATTITNNAGATIVGQGGFAIRLENKTGTAADNDTIVNYGTIIGNGSIPDPNAIVTLQNGTPDTGSVGTLDGVTYTGTGSARFIRGDGSAIQMGEGADTLTNYGTIVGNSGRAINMEGGNDTINLATGSSITGRIDGGSGTDTINLFGTGTGTLANVTNVELLSVQGGTWSLLDAQSYVNGVTISTGATLRIGAGGTSGSLAADVVDNGALAFNRSDALTYSGAISGTGTVQQIGTGTTTLTGASTYTGATTVAAGRLVVNGSIANSVVTVSGGTLGGSGTIGGLVAAGSGTIAPGNSIGQLNVAGNVAFRSGSTYQVEVNPAGQGDRIAATGTATLQGGTVQVLAANGNYANQTRYTILTAARGVTGQFDGATSNLAFLYPTLSYGTADVALTLTRNDVSFASVAATRNQLATALAVSSLGAANPVYLALLSRTPDQARLALTLLSGEVQASQITSQYQVNFILQQLILARLTGGFGTFAANGSGFQGFASGSSVDAAYAADLPGRRPATAAVPVGDLDPQVFSTWGSGFGSFGSTRTDGNAGTMTRDVGGFVVGADATIDGMWRIGLAGGYTRSTFDVRATTSSGETETGFGAIYGGTRLGPVTLRLGGLFAGSSSATRRSVVFPGFVDNVSARFGGTGLLGFAEAGYRIDLDPVTLEPFVGGSAMRLSRDGFTERGGPAALVVAGRDYDIQTFTVGGRGSLAFGPDSPVSARGTLAYRRAFGDVVPTALLAFAGGGSQFQTAGIPVDVNALVAEAGFGWQATRDLALEIAYTGQIGSRAQDHGVKGSLLYRF